MGRHRPGALLGAEPQERAVLIVPAGGTVGGAPSDVEIAGVFADSSSSMEILGDVAFLGAPGDLGAKLGQALQAARADIALWSAPPPTRALARESLREANDVGCKVFVATADGAQRRPLALDDLFTRPALDDARLSAAAVFGKRVLITGGGGSIGAELARRIAAFGPQRLAVIDVSEFNIYSMLHDAAAASPAFEAILCDITDRDEVRAVMARERPDIVFHAAALKHVPLVEKHPCRGVKVNVLGTRCIVEACAAVGADLVFVSTDKAVDPKGVMGATKRLAGLYCRARDVARPHRGRSIVVRLGNVVGSAGSVSELFQQQLDAGGPITITDPRAERYFITLGQAADSLLRAAAVGLAPHAPRGAAYTLDMGAPVPIIDLAHDIIRLAGQRPDVDAKIAVVGLRPGEKLSEILIAEEESAHPTRSPAVHMVEGALPPLAEIEAELDALISYARENDDEAVRAMLSAVAALGPALRRAVG